MNQSRASADQERRVADEVRWVLAAAWVVSFVLAPVAAWAETYRGIVVAPEHRCAPYDRNDYPYSQSVEAEIVASMGAVYGPYSGTCFAGTWETDIEHMVATSEAHDSGLCGESPDVKAAFASDLANLTLASPSVNRHQKSGKDVAEWIPKFNACWFVERTLTVRRKYGLTIDRAELEAVQAVLADCSSNEMVVLACDGAAPKADRSRTGILEETDGADEADALLRWDDDNNGRITCAEARRHGIAPVRREHPAYEFMRDGDGDGVVCE